MSNFGGANSAFELSLNKKLTSLNKKLTRIESNIYSIVLASGRDVKPTKQYWNKVRKEIDLEYQALVNTYAQFASKEVPIEYRKAVRQIGGRINNTKSIANTAQLAPEALIKSPASQHVSSILVQSAVTSYTKAANRGRAKLHRWTKATQQQLLTDKFIEARIFNVFTNEGTLTAAAKALGSDFWKAASVDALGQRYVQTRSVKNGITTIRNFKPDYYAELVSRVKFHEAHSAGAIQQAENYDTDLIIVSTHNTQTEICQQYEGKIYSLTGTDKRFPVLDQTAPFHPNCLHLIYPQFVEALEIQGTLEGFSDFSLGKTDRPPAPAGFVPVKDRVPVKPVAVKPKAKAKPKTTPKPKPKQAPGTNIDFGYPKGRYNNLVKDIRPEAKSIINKYPKPNAIATSKRPRYNIGEKKIYTDIDPKSFNHEYGHYLDHTVLKGDDVLSLTQDFSRAYKLDKKMYNSVETTRLMDITNELGYNPKTSKAMGLSDIFDSFKNGEIYDKYGRFGHGHNYYDRLFIGEKESFANLFEMWATDDSWTALKGILPNLTGAFEKIVKGL